MPGSIAFQFISNSGTSCAHSRITAARKELVGVKVANPNAEPKKLPSVPPPAASLGRPHSSASRLKRKPRRRKALRRSRFLG